LLLKTIEKKGIMKS